MNESVIATYDDVKFIQGVTKMNQNNWQDYFGNALKTGVYSGFDPNFQVMYRNSGYALNDGILFANGIFIKIETDDGYTLFEPLAVANSDRFVCARVNFDTGNVELVQKTGIADFSGASSADAKQVVLMKTLMEFEHDEAYCCRRDSAAWEIPLFYSASAWVNGSGSDVSAWLNQGADLTRRPNMDKKYIRATVSGAGDDPNRIQRMPITGNNTYYVPSAGTDIIIFPDTVNPANGAMVILTGTSTSVALSRIPFILWWSISKTGWGPYYFSSSYEIKYIFANPSGWTTDNTKYTYVSTSKATTAIRLTCIGADYTEGSNCNYIFYVEELS